VSAVAPYQALALRHTAVYRDSLRAAGLRLYVWSVNTPERWGALPDCLDGVMTDRVGEAVTW
jgi:glycerophosphoryl diester phosphodiesterase